MLEGLDKVDWVLLQQEQIKSRYYYHGNSTNIPKILPKLWNGGIENDLFDLFEAMSIVSGLTPATIITLPFLLQLALHDNCNWRLDILDLLNVMLKKNPKREGRWLTDDYLGNKFYEVMEDQEAYLLRLLLDRSPAIRYKTLDILQHLRGEYNANILQILWTTLENETDQRQRIYTIKYMTSFSKFYRAKVHLPELHEKLISRLFAELHTTKSNYLKTLLAYSIISVLNTSAPPTAVKILVDSIVQAQLYCPDDPSLTKWDSYYLKMDNKVDLLYATGKTLARPALFHILKYAEFDIDWSAQDYIYLSNFKIYVAVLDCLFYQDYFTRGKRILVCDRNTFGITLKTRYKQIIKVAKLDEHQLEFLSWLVNDDHFWSKDHNLLVWYGLPALREGLRQFLKKHTK